MPLDELELHLLGHGVLLVARGGGQLVRRLHRRRLLRHHLIQLRQLLLEALDGALVLAVRPLAGLQRRRRLPLLQLPLLLRECGLLVRHGGFLLPQGCRLGRLLGGQGSLLLFKNSRLRLQLLRLPGLLRRRLRRRSLLSLLSGAGVSKGACRARGRSGPRRGHRRAPSAQRASHRPSSRRHASGAVGGAGSNGRAGGGRHGGRAWRQRPHHAGSAAWVLRGRRPQHLNQLLVVSHPGDQIPRSLAPLIF
mmetsp:Transcript_10481/g.31566  ORF Transcript_10481/g.31566 Transcript_10481/m.31566 type:complete len:250 (-) Transcript_10481:582-1331(-)